MKKRILAVVLAAAMLALLATGCSANGTADNSKDGAVAIGGLAPLTVCGSSAVRSTTRIKAFTCGRDA